jgi:hypothetical protein
MRFHAGVESKFYVLEVRGRGQVFNGYSSPRSFPEDAGSVAVLCVNDLFHHPIRTYTLRHA